MRPPDAGPIGDMRQRDASLRRKVAQPASQYGPKGGSLHNGERHRCRAPKIPV